MKKLRQYKIGIYGLSVGEHTFSFEYDEEFFAIFENSLISKGKGTCHVDLIKSASMVTLTMKIEGVIGLTCDRSLEPFDYAVDASQELIYKFGDEDKELSDNMFVIRKDTQEVNIGRFLYEFISLEIPMKKLHPRFHDENETDELIYSSNKNDEKDKDIDPRWEALKKLK
ncbi:MAG: DUF177 domain-containing protein [Bacteroidota bacterium]